MRRCGGVGGEPADLCGLAAAGLARHNRHLRALDVPHDLLPVRRDRQLLTVPTTRRRGSGRGLGAHGAEEAAGEVAHGGGTIVATRRHRRGGALGGGAPPRNRRGGRITSGGRSTPPARSCGGGGGSTGGGALRAAPTGAPAPASRAARGAGAPGVALGPAAPVGGRLPTPPAASCTLLPLAVGPGVAAARRRSAPHLRQSCARTVIGVCLGDTSWRGAVPLGAPAAAICRSCDSLCLRPARKVRSM